MGACCAKTNPSNDVQVPLLDDEAPPSYQQASEEIKGRLVTSNNLYTRNYVGTPKIGSPEEVTGSERGGVPDLKFFKDSKRQNLDHSSPNTPCNLQ